VAWRQRIAFPPIPSIFTGADRPSEGELGLGILDLPLAVPDLEVQSCESKAHTRIGWLRSVANVYHAFAVQSFIDELAHARGKDPKDNLLEVWGPPRVVTPKDLGVAKVPNYGQSLDEHPVDVARHHRVVQRVTELSGWSGRAQGKRALGLAAHRSFLTYVAVVASVVQENGKLKVDEAWIVADAGRVVNLERVRSQLEGAVIFGISLALYGAITMKAGATQQTNFRDYRLARMAEAPRRIHVEVVQSDGPPGGVGEPGVPPVAPAIANAVFVLTGKRVRELPIARTVPA
jgi:isoquinoline 1-oxidoreductase beta subunit